MRFSQFAVLAGAIAALMASLLPASAWELKAMNEQIEKTNVIVSDACSGTVISVKDRLVLTAYHCITGNIREVTRRDVDPKTGEIRVRTVQETTPMYIALWKRKDYDVISTVHMSAIIKGFDAASDTAILQVEDADWKPEMAAPFAPDDYPYLRGQTVFCVGNPGILFDHSVTTGIISAPKRKLDFGNGTKIPLFQHSASAIGGNSGGAVYDDQGRLIGTLTGGVRGADISLAVPISYTKALLRRIGFGDVLNK